VKRLRLSKALTIPESTTILEACRRMAVRRVDAVLLTDSNALLCGILTDKVCFFFFMVYQATRMYYCVVWKQYFDLTTLYSFNYLFCLPLRLLCLITCLNVKVKCPAFKQSNADSNCKLELIDAKQVSVFLHY
jgi:CBS domain